MKTKTFKTILITIPGIMLLAIGSRPANAQEYLTVYMDSVSYNDTIYGCDTYDSVKFVPNAGTVTSKFWIVCEFLNSHSLDCDTIFPDTLYLPSGFNGLVSYQGYEGMNYYGSWVHVKPLSLLGEDKTTICRGTIQLNVYTCYSGSGNPTYNWIPTTGLSNPDIPNPTAIVTDNIEYTITMNAPNGCIISKDISVTLQPLISPPICLVSVDSTNQNIIYWEKPVSESVDSFYIYKETNVTDVYKKIGAVSYSDHNVFLDTASNAQIQSNKYEISVKDSCGYESARSTPHKTMHLTLNQGLNNVWNLIWEPYIGIPVSTYYIYRGITPKNLELIGTTSGSNAQYSDLSAPVGHVHYQIEIVSPVECNVPDAGFKSTAISVNTSRSNMVSFTPSRFDEIIVSPELFSVYPNPAKEILYLESNQKYIAEARIELCNMLGRVIQEVTLKSSNTQMDISDLEGGFYILRIKIDNGIIIKKFTKE